jgi:hypothetical protein
VFSDVAEEYTASIFRVPEYVDDKAVRKKIMCLLHGTVHPNSFSIRLNQI